MTRLLRFLGAMPSWLGAALAGLGFVLLYYVFRYRRNVVRENLRHAFPAMSPRERAAIERASYQHFCTLFTEILRSTGMQQSEFARRVHFSNPEMLREATDDFASQAIVLLIHQGNWEWMLHSAMAQFPVSFDPVYKPLHSKFWDDHMLAARSRFGASPMAINEVGREVIRGRRRQRIIVMLADQAGPRHGGYWTSFLNRPASFYRGADTLAQTLKLPVLFAQCSRESSGHYRVHFHQLSKPPHAQNSEEILERYVRMAESMIAEQPETYLWTNRRWKKQPPEPITPETSPDDNAPQPAG